MKWTKEKPTKPGWYWVSVRNKLDPEYYQLSVWQVAEQNGQLSVHVEHQEFWFSLSDNMWDDCLWSDEPVTAPSDQ